MIAGGTRPRGAVWQGQPNRAILPAMAHGETPFLGRDDDLARVSAGIGLPEPGDDGPAGHGGAVVLSGPAGIGKTRLVSHLVGIATGRGMRAAVGHCVGQAGAAIPYLPISELLGSWAAREPAAFEDALRRFPVLARLLPGRWAGDGATTPWDGADPGAIAEAVHALLASAGAEQPLLLVVEDAHWADHSTRDLLTVLLTRGFETAVSLVITYRSDDLHRRHPLQETLALWARLPGVRDVRLGPLPDATIAEVVRNAAIRSDGRGLTAERVRDIAERAEGNPFFAEELATVRGEILSDTLTRVLLAHYEGLEPRTKTVLRAVAAHGRRIDHELLSRVVAMDADALDESLRAGIESGMLTVDREQLYCFRHALLAEAISTDLLPGERTRLHRAFVAALTADAALAPPSELARHAAAAGDRPTAIEAAVRAGRSAYAMGGPRDALDHFERALTWMGEDDPLRDTVTLEASRAAHTSGDTARAIKILADRLDHPGTRQTPDDRARLLAAYARQARYSDSDRGGSDRAAEAYALVSEAHTPVRLEVLIAYLEHLIDQQDVAAAAPVGEEARALAAELALPDAEIDLRTVLARGMYRMGDLENLEAHLRQAITEGRIADPSVQVLTRLQLATLEHTRGRLREELALHDDGAALAAASGRWGVWETLARTQAAGIAFELGDFDGALARLTVVGARPHPAADAALRAARAVVRFARDGLWSDAELAELRQWWDEAYVALLCMSSGIDALGTAGRPEEAITLMADGVAVLDTAWGDDHEAIIRLTSLLAGVLADAVPRADRATAARHLSLVESYARRAHDVAGAIAAPGDESRAWLARLDADVLRLRWRAGEAIPLEDLVTSWRGAVQAFEQYGHRYELARSQLRLAEVLRAAGHHADVQELHDAVRAAATELPSEPLRRALAAAGDGAATAGTPARAGAPAAPAALTAREMEVLRLLARGRTNGQIAAQLFISVKTASVHVTHLLGKLGASSRGEAVAIARDRGLVD